MITVYEYPETDCGFAATGNVQQEYSCPECFAALKWRVGTALSPYNCLKCQEIQMDITKIISNLDWRIAYHTRGETAVRCGSSVHV
jgi:hypothetical protein